MSELVRHNTAMSDALMSRSRGLPELSWSSLSNTCLISERPSRMRRTSEARSVMVSSLLGITGAPGFPLLRIFPGLRAPSQCCTLGMPSGRDSMRWVGLSLISFSSNSGNTFTNTSLVKSTKGLRERLEMSRVPVSKPGSPASSRPRMSSVKA